MKRNLLPALVFIFTALTLSAQNLPHYKLTIAPADLDSMYAHAADEVYFPAVLEVETFSYAVMARFKGSTTLAYPKKSWAIKFDDSNNYFGVGRINLHADYKDPSAMRNFLIMKLFAFLGYPASQIKHVTYEVNGTPYGVYTQTEQIDSEYLTRNGRIPVSLYKANNHGALMAPAVRDDYYNRIWEIEAGGDASFNELRTLFNKCLYWSKNDFDARIVNMIDVDNFLNFFAEHFVFVSQDNFTKNIFLNKNSLNQKYELLPWDNEGSFGNSAIGIFDSTLTDYNMRDAHTPEYQVVFQRLLENPTYKALFSTKVNRILTDGFSYLDTLIDNTYLKIKPDVYADTKKEETNEAFDNEIPRLKWFMTTRKTFLENNLLPVRNPLSNFYCSNPFPEATNSTMTIRITSPVVQRVNLYFADSVNFNSPGQTFKFSGLRLYDDGAHDDLLPNDLVYGNTLDANNFLSPLIPFAITGAEQNYPPNGIFYIDYYGSKSYAINKGNAEPGVSDRVQIGDVHRFENKYFVEVINSSSTLTADISYCHLRTDSSFQDFMFRDNVVLAPNETIYVAANDELGTEFFPANRSFSNLYYELAVNDSLHLLSPLLTKMSSKKVTGIQNLSAGSTVLVINEINYKSSVAKPMGDWVEIYNPGTSAVEMTGWVFKDGDNKHAYTFPTGYSLPADGYVVIAEDLIVFQAACPSVSNVVGSTAFGLSSAGEFVRLFDQFGQLVDSVDYKNSSPWPVEAAGTGATLELKNYSLDNTIGSNWIANTLKNGSPGVVNAIPTNLEPLKASLFVIYPNPVHGSFILYSSIANLRVEILTAQGSVLKSLEFKTAGERPVDVSKLTKGLYLIRVTGDEMQQIEKLIVR